MRSVLDSYDADWHYLSKDVAVSFDVFLFRFKNGSADADGQGVRNVLAATTYSGPDELGFYSSNSRMA